MKVLTILCLSLLACSSASFDVPNDDAQADLIVAPDGSAEAQGDSGLLDTYQPRLDPDSDAYNPYDAPVHCAVRDGKGRPQDEAFCAYDVLYQGCAGCSYLEGVCSLTRPCTGHD